MKKAIIFILLLSISSYTLKAQLYSNKVVGQKHQPYSDSLKVLEYPYVLPIWGAKATEKGFDLPLPAGLSVQYIWMKQDLVIDNLYVGFNNGPQYNLDEIIRFDNAISEASGLNIRPDIWLLPFLNVYGIFAVSKPSTTVNFGVWLPDTTGAWNEAFNTSTIANFDAFSVGFGMTPTIGVGGGFLALDMNVTWTDISALEKPAFSFIFDPRFGKTFKFKKERNLALWVGAFRWNIKSETKGSLALSDIMDSETGELGGKIDEGLIKVDDAHQQIDMWWTDLSPIEQANPINKAKYETANKAIETAGNFLTKLDGAVNSAGNSTVQYSLSKRPALMWNFLIGGQFQLNKHFMVRAEYGFLGSRQQFFTGLQYRFGF